MPWSIIEILRKNPDVMRENLMKRFMDPQLVDEFIHVDTEWRRVQTELNKLRHKHNVISSQIPKLSPEERRKKIEEARNLLKVIESYERKLKEVSEYRRKLLDSMPSIIHKDVPIGPDESFNKVVRVWGKAKVQKKHLRIFLAETLGQGHPMEYELLDYELVGHADMLEKVL